MSFVVKLDGQFRYWRDLTEQERNEYNRQHIAQVETQKRELIAQCSLKMGDTVTRKAGRKNQGKIIGFSVKDSKLRATVEWQKVYKRFSGGDASLTSRIDVNSLKKVS